MDKYWPMKWAIANGIAYEPTKWAEAIRNGAYPEDVKFEDIDVLLAKAEATILQLMEQGKDAKPQIQRTIQFARRAVRYYRLMSGEDLPAEFDPFAGNKNQR